MRLSRGRWTLSGSMNRSVVGNPSGRKPTRSGSEEVAGIIDVVVGNVHRSNWSPV